MHAGWPNLIWPNFARVAYNSITICSLAYIGTCNRLVKFGLKIPNCLAKMLEKLGAGDFLYITDYHVMY